MKKLFTLTVFAIGSFLGVQAQDQTLIDFPTNADGIAFSGTTLKATVKIHNNTDDKDCFQLKNGYTSNGKFNTNAIKLGVDGGFKPGDVLTIAGAINNKDASKRGTAVVFLLNEDSTCTKLFQFSDFINGRLVADEPVEESFTIADAVDTLYIGRDGGTAASLTLIKVVRPASVPAITAVGTVGVERTITIGTDAAGKTIKVDWGDGNLVEQTSTQAYDGWDGGMEFTGTPAGEGVIKIYGEGIIYIEANGKFNDDKSDIPNALTAIDIRLAPELDEAALNANKIMNLDLSKSAKLKKLNIANNKFSTINLASVTALTNLTANDNELTALDLSKNTALTAIVLSNNKLTTLDLSNNTLLKTMTVMNNEIEEVVIGANTAKGHTIQFGGNKLKSIDLSQMTDISTSFVYLRDNVEMNDIVFPEGKTVRRLWVDGDAFTLAQLYDLKNKVSQTFTYATTYASATPQAPMTIEVTDGKVDLSSQAILGETMTEFTWIANGNDTLKVDVDYTVSDGVFTFKADKESAYCIMTNAELPLFTLAKPFVTTAVDIAVHTGINDVFHRMENEEKINDNVIYNLNGQRVSAPQKGLFIRNGKKVILK